jgi:hypothetical protein
VVVLQPVSFQTAVDSNSSDLNVRRHPTLPKPHLLILAISFVLHHSITPILGRAIIHGLDHMKEDAAVIMMADESDDCRDVVRYWQKLSEGWDCVFGSRFLKGGGVIDCPWIKQTSPATTENSVAQRNQFEAASLLLIR